MPRCVRATSAIAGLIRRHAKKGRILFTRIGQGNEAAQYSEDGAQINTLLFLCFGCPQHRFDLLIPVTCVGLNEVIEKVTRPGA